MLLMMNARDAALRDLEDAFVSLKALKMYYYRMHAALLLQVESGYLLLVL